jgi:hypothetical protein
MTRKGMLTGSESLELLPDMSSRPKESTPMERACSFANAFFPHARQNFFVILFLFLLTALFFWPWLMQGKIFIAADFLYTSLPWSDSVAKDFRPHNSLISDPVVLGYPSLYNQQVKAGHLNQWNPAILGGLPAVNSPFAGFARYYLPNVLAHRFFDTQTALMLLLFLHLWLSGCFMYAYLNCIGLPLKGALFGAIVWMFSGSAMVWFEFLGLLISFAFCPLMLFILEQFSGPKRYSFAFLGGLSFGTYILAMHIQYLLYLFVIAFFYGCFLLLRLMKQQSDRKAYLHLISCFMLMFGLAMFIGIAEIYPMYELIQDSFRGNRNLSFIEVFNVFGRVYLRYLVTLIFPDYFGSPVRGFNWIPSRPEHEYMNYNELCIYMGITTLFAVVAAVLARKDRYAVFWLAMALLFGSMMVGGYTYYPLYRFVPGLGKLNPLRIIFLFTLAMSICSGIGMASLDALSRSQKKVFVALASAILVLAFVIWQFSHTPEMIAFFNQEQVQSASGKAILYWLARFRSPDQIVLLQPFLFVLLSFLVFSLHLVTHRAFLKRFSLIVIFCLLGFDLLSFGRYYNTAVPANTIYPTTPAIEFLKRQEGVFRVVLDCSQGFINNILGPFGIEELGGYANAYSMRANRLLSFIETGDATGTNRFDRWVQFRRHGQWRFYNMMNVRFILSSKEVDTGLKFLKPVYRNEVSIFENEAFLKRAYIVHKAIAREGIQDVLVYMARDGFDPAAEIVLDMPPSNFEPGWSNRSDGSGDLVRITQYTADRIAVEAESAADGWMVLSNTWNPSWEALCDGQPIKIECANGSIMAIRLPKGRHHLTWQFNSKSQDIALGLTLFGYLISLMGYAECYRRQRYGSTHS